MICFDLTCCCKSPKNTGMQRTTRALFLHLRQRQHLVPIYWNVLRQRYEYAGKHELQTVEEPFRILPRALARPDNVRENFFAELYRGVTARPLDYHSLAAVRNTLVVPDLFRDGRLRLFPRLLKMVNLRSVAIFHDAAAIELHELSSSATITFQRYLTVLALFDLVLCVSIASQQALLKFWQENGVAPADTRVERWPVEFGARNIEAPGANTGILCVATLEPRKNHLTLLRAARKLWEQNISFNLRLTGRSTRRFGRVVLPIMRRLQESGYPLTWLMHVNDDRLLDEYRKCRFTVYPSLSEGFGLPVYESLWHGRPCVCGSNGALGEASKGGGCLLVEQANPDSLADGMRQLLVDEESYKRLVEEAARRSFRTWPAYIEQFETCLQLAPAASR